MGRAMIAMQLFESAKKRYAALDETSPDYATQLERTHRETAAECLKLAQTKGGIYNKAAQFVASLQGGAGDAGIPKAYVETLAVLTDKAPFHPFDVMDECFAEEFGVSATEAFASVDEVPIAAASLAQVHRAVTKDGTEVAVKMQYPWLRRHLASDFAVFDMFAQQIKPGGFDLSWVVKDFQVALTAELDFEGEARNAERCAEDLKHRADVLVPDVIRAFTSTRVLTTRFVPNMTRCNDPGELAAAGFSPRRVGAAIASVFAEMTFVHGHVHGDPHAGNVYVIPRERRRSDDGDDESMTETTHDASYTLKGRNPKRFSRHDAASRHDGGVPPTIVLLDHGLYHDISDDLRADFCELVRASVNRDAFTARKMSIRFCGESGGLFRFFPLVLSPWFVFSSDVTAADLQAARKGALPPNTNLEDIGKFLVSLHDEGGTNMLGVLHSLGYTRGILNDLKFPEHLRLRAFAKFATLGVAVKGQNSKAVVSSGISSMVAFSLLLAQVRVEVLKWIIAVLTPVAPILAIAGKGSPGLAATMVSPAAHGLAALAVFFARLTEHPELMC
jgi:aarF domain-containing kinase